MRYIMKSDTDKLAVNKINSAATRSNSKLPEMGVNVTQCRFSTLKAQCVTLDKIYWHRIELKNAYVCF